MNVTFDTNVFLSGFTRTQGRTAQALANITSGLDTLFASPQIIDELTRVLAKKFAWTGSDLEEVRIWFSENARLVVPTETLRVLTDEPDNRILECTLAANADVIVTGDRAMLALGSIGDILIMSVADYLNGVDDTLTTSG